MGDLRRRPPREARLQLAPRPLMIGVESSQALFAASASLKVTYTNRIFFKNNEKETKIVLFFFQSYDLLRCDHKHVCMIFLQTVCFFSTTV